VKVAAHPCSFKFYNKDNPTGSDKKKYFVASFSFSGEAGPTSDVVSGDLCVDQITVEATIVVVNLAITYEGSASFVFPARHWAFALDGHATLAELDTVELKVKTVGVSPAGVPVYADFDITAEIETSGQAVYDDWSAV
jgi:hypothetical protein